MFARVTMIDGDPGKIDEMIQITNSEILPQAQGAGGFKGMQVLADRSSGKGLAITFWATEEEMKASEELGTKLRTDSMKKLGSSVAGVERFEVVVQA